jgi:plasmid stability protein
MSSGRRTTVYLDPEVHQALRLKAASTECSVSEMVNAALRQALAEDASDLEDFEKRRSERSIPFEDFVVGLRRRGKL